MNAIALTSTPSTAEDPYSDDNLRDPYPLFERVRDAGPVVFLERYGWPVLARDEQVRAALSDPVVFTSGAGVGPRDFTREGNWRTPGILESDAPRHTVLRAALDQVITARSVRGLRSVFASHAEEVVDGLVDRGRFDAVTDLAEPFPLQVFGDAVGIPGAGRAQNLLRHGVMHFSTFGPDDARHRAYFAAGEGSHEWVVEQCGRENLTPGGLGARLWEQVDAGALSAEHATILVRSLLSAGLDTTVLAIGNTLRCLLAAPGAWEALRQDSGLVRFAVDEALRYESPFQSYFRTTSSDTVVEGVEIAAGTKVLLLVGSANRDPRRWGDDADRFRVDRNAGGHLAFGRGIHHCVGQPITRLETEVLLTELVRRVRTLEPDGEAVPFIHNTLRGWTSLPVAVTPA